MKLYTEWFIPVSFQFIPVFTKAHLRIFGLPKLGDYA